MKSVVTLLAVALLGLLAGSAKACDYNKAAVVNTVQVVATPVYATVAVPVVQTQVVAVPVYATPVFVQNVAVGYGGYGNVAVVHGNYGRNVNVNVRNGRRGAGNGGSGIVGILGAVARTAGNVVGAVVGGR